MADIRGLTLTGPVQATAGPAPPAGFTPGHEYKVIGLAVDCGPATPVLYALLIDDAWNARYVQLPTSGAGPFTIASLA